MPLDRLNPRSRRTGLRLQRKRSSSSKQGSSRHLRLWDAIQRTRDELALWQAQVEQVEGLFRAVILPREKRLTEAFGTLTTTLIDRFAPNDLPAADQSLLGLWITENLQTLNTHPFATQQSLQKLINHWEVTLDRDAPVAIQLRRLANQRGLFTGERASGASPGGQSTSKETHPGYTADDDDEDREFDEDDVVFDFGWHASSSSSTGTRQRPQEPPEQAAEPESAQQSYGTHQEELSQQALDKKIKHLQDGLSVDRLFRRLARVLHPDREPDESLKQEKHVLMSQCLKARDEDDIHTLLAYYCEYVGELPEDIGDDSHEQLIQALEQQLKQLQAELRQRRVADPLHEQIVDRYHAASDEGRQHNIERHARILDSEIEQVQRDYRALQQAGGLQHALLARRDIELNRLSINEMTGLS